jgi:hypothetical protein
VTDSDAPYTTTDLDAGSPLTTVIPYDEGVVPEAKNGSHVLLLIWYLIDV